MRTMIENPVLDETSINNPTMFSAISVVGFLNLNSLKQVYESLGDDEVNKYYIYFHSKSSDRFCAS